LIINKIVKFDFSKNLFRTLLLQKLYNLIMKTLFLLVLLTFAGISFSQGCLYSDESDKFNNTRTQTSNGSPFNYGGVSYNVYFRKTYIDTTYYYTLRFAKNSAGSSSQMVNEGDKLILILTGGSKIELSANTTVTTTFVAQRSIVNVPYSLSEDNLFRLSQLVITDIRFYHGGGYSDILIKKPKIQSKIINAAICISSAK
jgi:hypothetical protein